MKHLLYSLFFILYSLCATAQTYTPMTFGKKYPVAAMGSTYFQVAAPANGKISLTGYNASPAIKSRSGEQIVATFNGIYGGEEAGYYFTVKAGMLYYITYTSPFADFEVMATFEKEGSFVPALKDVTPAEGSPFDVTNDGILQITFNTNEVEFHEGTLTCGSCSTTVYPQARWNELIASGILHYSDDGASGVVENWEDFVWGHYDHGFRLQLGTVVYGWMSSGKVKEGDELVMKLTGIKCEGQQFGSDGSLTLRWKISKTPLTLVSAKVPAAIKSWFNEGDEEGIAVFTFSDEVGSASAHLMMGNAEVDDVWVDEDIANRVTIEGNTVKVDFTGVMRTYKTMNLNIAWNTFEFKLLEVRDPNGQSCYSGEHGTIGSFSYTLPFKDITDVLAYEILPASGTRLTEENQEVEIWVGDTGLVHYDGIEVSWTTTEGDLRDEFIDLKDCQLTTEGKEQLICFRLPTGAKDGYNVRVSLHIIWTLDGTMHPVAAYYNSGIAYEWDIAMFADPVSDSKLNILSEVYLPLFSTYAINTDKKLTACVKTADEEYYTTVKLKSDGMTNAKIVFDEPVRAASEVTITVPEGAIGDYTYGESQFTAGLASKAFTLVYNVTGNWDGRDVVATPGDGDTVESIESILLTFFNYNSVNPTWDVSVDSYVEEVVAEGEGARFTGHFNERADGEKVNNLVTFTLDSPITAPGTYRFVLGSGAVCNAATGDPIYTEYSFTIRISLDGIATVTTDSAATAIHSLTGTRLARPIKGINIMNGKKVVL